jgi:hypothetical protein
MFLLLQFRSTLSDMIIAVGLALLLCLFIEMPFSALTTVLILPGKLIHQSL